MFSKKNKKYKNKIKQLPGKIIRLAKTKTAKNTYLVFGGNSLAGFLGFLLMIFLSRHLGPTDFGSFSVAFSLLALFSKFADLGLNFAMVKDISQSRTRGDNRKIKKIFETVFVSKIFLSIFVIGLYLIFSSLSFSKLFQFLNLSNLNIYILAGFSLFVFYDLVKVFFQANKRFLESVLLYVLGNILKIILVFCFLLVLPSFKNFIIIYFLGPFLSALFFFSKLKLKLSFNFHWKEFKHLFQFAGWMAVSVFFAAVAENLNIFMISSYLSQFETGIYSAAEKFTLPFSIFAGALGTVLTSRTSEFLEFSHIKKFVKKIAVVQAGLFLILLAVLPFTGLITIFLGGDYSASVSVLRILLIAVFFRLAITPLNSVFYPLEKPFIFAFDSIVKVVLLLFLNHRFLYQFQAKGAAISLLIVNIVIFVINYLYLFLQLKNNR